MDVNSQRFRIAHTRGHPYQNGFHEQRQLKVPIAIASRLETLRACPSYRKYGVCRKNEATFNCPHVHVQHLSQLDSNTALEKIETGEILPCVFFNKGMCYTPNCPFPHIKPIPEGNTIDNPPKESNKANPEKTQPGAAKRYYHKASIPMNCVQLVVPRPSTNHNQHQLPNIVPGNVASKLASDFPDKQVSLPVIPDDVSKSDTRRERIMAKVAFMKKKYQVPKETPPFLAFKK